MKTTPDTRSIIVRAYIPACDDYGIIRFPINLPGYFALDLENDGTRTVRHISQLQIQPAIQHPTGA
jgi:hypothetical protein